MGVDGGSGGPSERYIAQRGLVLGHGKWHRHNIMMASRTIYCPKGTSSRSKHLREFEKWSMLLGGVGENPGAS